MNLNRLISIFLFLGISIQYSFAQNFFVNESNGKLVALDLNGCTSDFILNIGSYTDIASHPDGFLYAINSGGEIRRINTTTGANTFLTDFPAGTGSFYALTADADGNIFAASSTGYLFSYNPAIGAINNHGNMGFNAAGDLTYYQSDLYMATDNNELAYIDPDNASNNYVYIDFSAEINSPIYGIVSSVNGCDVRTYALSNDNDSRVYQIDWDNQTVNFICTIDHKVYGGASEFEFNASADAVQTDNVNYIVGDCNSQTGGVSIAANSVNGSVEYSIDGINYQSSGTFTNLALGDYTIYIQDVAGCVGTEDITIAPNSSLSIVDIFITDATCMGNDGSVAIGAISSGSDLMYSLDGINFQGENNFNNLPEGNHTAYVSDADGCISQEDFEILTEVNLEINSIDENPASCHGDDGSVSINASSNTNLMYSLDGISFQEGNSFDNLSLGNYTVYVSDEEGCLKQEDFEIIIGINAEINSIIPNPATCNTDNGSVNISANGSGNLQYSLDGVDFQDENLFENLPPGNYEVIISDADNCTLSQNFIIEEISPFTLDNINATNTTCGEDNGSIEIYVNDNGNSISYSLDGQTYISSNIFENLSGGDYTIYMQDENECLLESETNLAPSSPLVLNEITTSPTDCAVNTGSIIIDADGGENISLIYQINDLQNNDGVFENIGSGNYEIFVRTFAGCEIGPFNETLADPCGIYIPNVFSPNGDRVNDVFKLYSPKEIEIKTCQIFNRWGGIVYQKDNYSSGDYFEGWDGYINHKKSAVGVYSYYFIIVKNGEESILTGDVTLTD